MDSFTGRVGNASFCLSKRLAVALVIKLGFRRQLFILR